MLLNCVCFFFLSPFPFVLLFGIQSVLQIACWQESLLLIEIEIWSLCVCVCVCVRVILIRYQITDELLRVRAALTYFAQKKTKYTCRVMVV